MDIIEAFDIGFEETISLIGGGGKTALIKLLAEKLKFQGKKALITTTTHMYPDICTIIDKDEERMYKLLSSVPANLYPVMCGVSVNSEGKMCGVSETFIQRLYNSGHFPYILIEADGAKGRPVKAFDNHEPVVPTCTTRYIAVVGLDCIGKVLNSENAHRPEIISSITGVPLDSVIDETTIVKLFTNRDGLLKGRNKGAKAIVVLNKADDDRLIEHGQIIGKTVLKECSEVSRVLVCSLTKNENIYRILER